MSKPARNQRGWGLTETLLTLGAIAVMSVAMYAVFKPADATAQVRIEQDNLRVLSRNVDRSFGLLGTFDQVSTSRVLGDDLAPSRMRASGDELRTEWGTVATVEPYENAARGISAGTAFSVTYPGTSGEVCAGLASAMARDAFDILVNGRSVYDSEGLNPARSATECADGNATMEFVFHSGLVSGQAVAAPPLVLPPAPPSTSPRPSSPPVMDIPENPGVDDATPGVIPTPPAGPAAPPPAPPPVTPPPAPAPVPITTTPQPPVPVTPPGSICTPPASWVDSQFRSPHCAAGQYGLRHEQRDRDVTYTCQSGNPGDPNYEEYSAWVDPTEHRSAFTSWYDTTNTCATCPTLAPEVETQWLTHTGTCPTGYLGTVSHEYEQSRSRTRTHVCPAGTENLPGITLGSWGSWTNTGNTRNPVNTCEPECVVPSPNPEVQRQDGTATRIVDCSAGQFGQINQSRPQHRTRTRTWSCPAATGSPTNSGWSSYGSWTQTGSWTETSRTCASCGTPTPQTRLNWQNRSSACPSGQSGSITWQEQRNQSQSGTYDCPAGTRTRPAPTWSGTWVNGSWTGNKRNESNTCTSETCRWRQVSAYYAPNFGSLDGEYISYSGPGVNCSASWGDARRGPGGGKSAVAACFNLMPTNPAPGSWYEYVEYSYGGTVENGFEYTADCTPPVAYRWERVSQVSGPGSGCHLHQDRQRAGRLIENNTLEGHGWNGIVYTDFSVHPSQSCSASNAGQSIVVFESCGGWQAGLEGRSGFQCRGSDGDGDDNYWDD